jgi:outer membrane protein TolC
MRRAVIITLFCFSSYLSAAALTLEEALINAYKTNPELNAQRESLKASDEQIMTAIHRWLPNITVSASKQSSTSQKALSTTNNVTTTTNTFSEGVTNQLTIAQNLFRSGGDIASLRVAKASIEQARAQLEAKEQEIFLKTVSAYLSVFRAKEKYYTFQEQERDTAKLVEGKTQQFKAGEIDKISLEVARSYLANVRSQRALANANYETARATFQAIVGLEPNDITLPKEDINVPKSITDTIDIALQKNPTLLAGKNALKSNEQNINVARSLVLPTVDLTHTISDSTKSVSTFRASASPRRDYTTALTVSVPIFGSTNSSGNELWSALRAAKRTAAAAKNNLNATMYSTEVSATQAWVELEAQRKVLNNLQDAVKAMQIAYRGAVKQEEAGLLSVVELIANYNDDNFDLSRKLIDAKAEYHNALYTLKSIVGECTAKGLKLNVPYYDPLKNYNSIKWQLIGAF